MQITLTRTSVLKETKNPHLVNLSGLYESALILEGLRLLDHRHPICFVECHEDGETVWYLVEASFIEDGEMIVDHTVLGFEGIEASRFTSVCSAQNAIYKALP
jgi:hypothetical protein